MRWPVLLGIGWMGAWLGLLAGSAAGQGKGARRAATVVVPQVRTYAPRGRSPIEIAGIAVDVTVAERVATTTMDIGLRNRTPYRLGAELVVPVPDGAVVRGFAHQGAARKPTAEVLPRDQARQAYEAIVAELRDPALLEFIGYNLVRTSVFPVEGRGRQKVRLVYEHLLEAREGRVEYRLPRSESVHGEVPWKIAARLKSARPISAVYSPTHRVSVQRSGNGTVWVQVASEVTREPGPFRLSWLVEGDGMAASLFAYPDSERDGGYFLLLGGLPVHLPPRRLRRELTLVLDRSGSMNGGKMRQVREAALEILRGLARDEAFNIITYNDATDFFADRPVLKTPVNEVAGVLFVNKVRSRGGTNVYEALRAALRQKPVEGMLPMVLFLTDGVPTVGRTSEKAIRELARAANPYDRRIFTFGVGVGVNTALLERLAKDTRGTSTFVLPKESVKRKLDGLFARLAGPVLADTELRVFEADGRPAAERVRDLIPARLPDLFVGDQLVVLGRYEGSEPLTLTVSGNYLGEQQAFQLAFDPAGASPRNAFVPRLWASRRIAVLAGAIRDLGADLGISPKSNDVHARLDQLVDEVVRLSTQFGILTEYTAFLAREGTDLARRDAVFAKAFDNFAQRALKTRSGIAALNQDLNLRGLRNQLVLNTRNTYLDTGLNAISTTRVQQVADRAFYRRRGGWVDSRILASERYLGPKQTIEFGSPQHMALAYRLAAEGRQGCLAFRGDILLRVGGEPVLIKGPASR